MSWWVVLNNGHRIEYATDGMAQQYIDDHPDDCATKLPLQSDGRNIAEDLQQLRRQLVEEDPNWAHKNFRSTV